MKRFYLISFLVIFLIGSLAYWLYNGPSKEITIDIMWAQDIETEQNNPFFLLYYVWDGVAEAEPTWMIFPKNGRWRVASEKSFERIAHLDIGHPNLKKIMLEESSDFNELWVETFRFRPRLTRYERLVRILGASA